MVPPFLAPDKNQGQDPPKKIEFSKWPDPIDGLPEELEKADVILVTHDHADHCKQVTINRIRRDDTVVIAPKRCIKKLGNDIKVIEPEEEITFAGRRNNVRRNTN
jgi:L-ascorbate metabolism protein UlaG (beta-lactamase superfamily)